MTNGSKKHAVIKLIALTKPNHDKKEYFANDTPDTNLFILTIESLRCRKIFKSQSFLVQNESFLTSLSISIASAK